MGGVKTSDSGPTGTADLLPGAGGLSLDVS